MADTTQVDYEQMQAIIKQLKAEEQEMAQLLKATHSKVESLHGNQWVGQGADKFFNEMEQVVLPAMSRLVHALDVAGNVAQQIVNTFRQAEEETKGYFNNLGG